MPRPSTNTDARLLKAGRDLLPQTGVSGMNIRQVAKKARVNVGMFHYHFKTKDVFARRVLQEHYEELFASIQTEMSHFETPLEQLRAVIVTFAKFTRDNRQLALSLIRDIATGEPATIDFLRANLHRHVQIILRLVGAAQAARQIGPIAPVNALSMLMSAANFPNILAAVAALHGEPERVGPVLSAFDQHVLTDEAIGERVDAILIGLVAQREDLPLEPEGAASVPTVELPLAGK